MIKKTIIPCADVKMHTIGTIMHAGETRNGSLHMHNDFLLEFHEGQTAMYKRNPKVYRGKLLNVNRDKQGLYQVHFHRMVLTKRMSAERVSKAICRDLSNAKKVLGL